MSVLAGPPNTVEAATLTVTSLGDTGAGTLRQAITDASPDDTIDFSVTGTITLSSGRLTVIKDLTITGPGASSLTISGNNSSGVFLTAIGTVAISGLTLTNGNVGGGQGGGVENQGPLTLTDVVVSNSVARLGGGIFNDGTLTLTRTTVSGNTDTQQGAGFYINGGTTNLVDSTVSGNVSAGLGGGFYISSGTVNLTRSTLSGNSGTRGGGMKNRGTVTLTNSTVSGNSATSGDGGGVWLSAGNLIITNSTITGNSATSEGGGIFDFSGADTTSLVNTIVAGNTAPTAPDCFGAPTSLGSNLIGNDSGCSYSIASGDIVGTFSSPKDPLLGSLQANGGPTFTHELLSGSEAIDNGDDGSAPATDQRGVSRPQDAASDIGAFELVTGTPVPGVTGWGLVAMAVLMAAFSGRWLRRRTSQRV